MLSLWQKFLALLSTDSTYYSNQWYVIWQMLNFYLNSPSDSNDSLKKTSIA